MTHHYFVAFQTSPMSGVLTFGNCEVVMRLPVTRMADVNELADAVARSSREITQRPIIISFQLLRTED